MTPGRYFLLANLLVLAGCAWWQSRHPSHDGEYPGWHQTLVTLSFDGAISSAFWCVFELLKR